MKNRVTSYINSHTSTQNKQFWGVFVTVMYAILWEILTIARCTKSFFWMDETYTFWITDMSVPDIIHTTAEDVHPPLYYFIVHFLVNILGKSPIVYHIISVIAYTAMLILAITIIRRMFNTPGAILFITFISILRNTTIQNIEVRMYSWAMLFVTVAYISLLYIIRQNEILHYIIYTLSVLAAAYTHYYAFMSVLIMTFALFVYALIKREILIRTTISCILAFIIYSPWLIVLYKTFRQKKEDYWITDIPSFIDCMKYIYKSEKYLEIILLVLSVICILYVTLFKKVTYEYTIWILIGLISVIGTALTGIAVSNIFRPLFQVKYMYPCISIIWIILIASLNNIQYGRIASLFLAVILLITCGRLYYNRILLENEYQTDQDATLSYINDHIDADTLIVFDNESIDWRSVLYYFPNNQYKQADDLDKSFSTDSLGNYMIITKKDMPDDNKCIQGRIGTDRLNIYIY